MHGMFRANGGCGYVKKPDFLMQNGPRNEVFDPKRTLPVKMTLKVDLSSLFTLEESYFIESCNEIYKDINKQVKVYMGDGWNLDFSRTHFDTYSPPDFYTKVKFTLFCQITLATL